MNGITLYQNGLGIDDKLRSKNGNVVRYFLTDHLGSTEALTDASGAVVSSTSYDSFGNSTSNISTSYRYTGREYDSETGLYYYRNRWYDPEIGRFISEDPIGFAGGDINLYGYVGNSPLGFTDPFGNYACRSGGRRGQDPCAKYIPKHIPPDKDTNRPVNIDDLIRETEAKLESSRQLVMELLKSGDAAAVGGSGVAALDADVQIDLWFRGKVKTGADWDFKKKGIQYEDFGNVSYGATGTAAGYSKDVLLRMAGWYQDKYNEGEKSLLKIPYTDTNIPYTGLLASRLGVGGKYQR